MFPFWMLRIKYCFLNKATAAYYLIVIISTQILNTYDMMIAATIPTASQQLIIMKSRNARLDDAVSGRYFKSGWSITQRNNVCIPAASNHWGGEGWGCTSFGIKKWIAFQDLYVWSRCRLPPCDHMFYVSARARGWEVWGFCWWSWADFYL